MIRSIEIKGLRGIREGKLDDLAPLTIFVGPNGSGKSTILDALLMGASPSPTNAFTEVVKRYPGTGTGNRWFFWRGDRTTACEFAVGTYGGQVQTCRLAGAGSSAGLQLRHSITGSAESGRANAQGSQTGAGASGTGRRSKQVNMLEDVPEIRLIDAQFSNSKPPLHRLWTATVEQGRRAEAIGITAEVVSGITNIEILTEGDLPVMHLVFHDHSLPATLAGDGVHVLLRLSLELASRRGGVVLLEEPEVHQHPGSIRQSARAILAAVRRDIQVILTTHSLELIDALLNEASEEDLGRTAVYRLQLDAGVLRSSRIPGPDASFARSQIEEDLR